MPVPAHLRYLYRTPSYRDACKIAFERAAGACEHCCAPNRNTVMRLPAYPYLGWWWEQGGKRGRDPWGMERAESLSVAWELVNLPRIEQGVALIEPYEVYIILAGCHVNHTAGDDRPENIVALCQRCHLLHDLAHHAATRARNKDADRPIQWEGGIAV